VFTATPVLATVLATVLAMVLALVLVLPATVQATVPATVPPASDEENGPVTTANPFFPDEQNLTDCVGLVERPGCGSESRGGLHQNLVAIIMVAGLLVVFGRVAWVIRRSHQRAADADTSPSS
jgi:hypothetical protein